MMGFDPEFVVAASQILDERMAADHDRGGPVAPQAAHRAEPGFQSAVIAFDPVVRILGRVVQPARPRGLDDQRGGAMHPPVNRDVIDVDAAFREQFFNVSVRESVTEAPTDGQQDHVGREPVAGERRETERVRRFTRARYDSHPIGQCNSACRSGSPGIGAR